ncbi:hypothetical protein VNO78_02767 [Psophocarpus tetragonolobus]|uniref:Uncharacterized protein n=1 Tax=Psophocarpus tetragonolobus TaxID=3891 RepID=A0AAN9SZX5_PSOTE
MRKEQGGGLEVLEERLVNVEFEYLFGKPGAKRGRPCKGGPKGRNLAKFDILSKSTKVTSKLNTFCSIGLGENPGTWVVASRMKELGERLGLFYTNNNDII